MNTDNQIVMLVDENDTFSGKYAKRVDAHTGKGLHHRAFVTLLENEEGEVLLQKRKHALWDGYWDTTAISHPLHLSTHDETYEEAAGRALKAEMGITGVELEKIGGFNYFAPHGKNCENEYCAILIGKYDGRIFSDDDLVYEYIWMNKDDFIRQSITDNETYTPWAILTGKFLAHDV